MMKKEDRWERFYTDASRQNGDSDLVNVIFIDVFNKVYVFDQEITDANIDGFDEFDNEIYSIYVSREVFDILLQGLKVKGYKQVK